MYDMNEKEKLFCACTKLGDFMYCVSLLEGALMRMDLNNGQLSLLGDICRFGGMRWSGGVSCIFSNGKIFLLDNKCRKIIEYNIGDDSSKQIKWDARCFTDKMPNYLVGINYGERIFIFPRYDNILYIFNSNKGAFEESIRLSSQEMTVNTSSDETIPQETFSRIVRRGDEVWLFTRKSVVICFSLSKKNIIRELRLPDCIDGCEDVILSNNICYILDINSNIYAWDRYSGFVKSIIKFNRTEHYYHRIVVTKKNMWILPGWGKEIEILDLTTNKLKTYDRYPVDFKYVMLYTIQSKYNEYTEDEKYFYFAMSTSNYMLVICKETGREQWIHPVAPTIDNRMQFILKTRHFIFESKRFNLNKFLDLFFLHKKNKSIKTNYVDIGSAILDEILH